jgi:hypothetical protein
MRFLTFLFPLLLVSASAAQAQPTKADCKAYAESIRELCDRLGLSPEITGRALLNTVEEWIESQDTQTIEQVIGEIEEATAGVRSCEAAGLSHKVVAVKGMCMRLESAVLPWLKSVAVVDPCQSLINQASRKRATDLDGAIADLERSVSECTGESWLPEAHRNLAEMYFERGDIEKDDYPKGQDQTRQAMKFSEDYDEENRRAFRAILAKPTIEAGDELMELGAFEEAKRHWEAYIDIFGCSSFDVLFDAEQVAQGAYMLRELRDAHCQLSRACVELGDTACVRNLMVPAAEEHKGDLRPIRDLTRRTFELAAETTGEGREKLYILGFDLLTMWRELDPDSRQINGLLERTLLAQARDERLALLRATDKCWIPMQVAEALRQESEDFIEEAELAAACGDSGAEAQQILCDFYVQAANDKLDQLGGIVRSVRGRRATIREVEEQLLPKIKDSAEAAKIRSRLAEERAKMHGEIARAEREKDEMYSGCTELLATIQWNIARETDYLREELDFKQGCCGFLLANTKRWTDWMRSRPEGERLADAEIDKKERLMKGYCAPERD